MRTRARFAAPARAARTDGAACVPRRSDQWRGGKHPTPRAAWVVLFMAGVVAGLNGCGGFSSGGRDGRDVRSVSRPGVRVVGRFVGTVRPDQNTITFSPDSGTQAQVALTPLGPADALRLTSSSVKYANGVLSGDVRVVSNHPLPLYDLRVVIEMISNTGVSVKNNGDGLSPSGKPSYVYGTLGSGAAATAISTAKKWEFNNASGVSFTFTAYVYANVWLPSTGDGNSINAFSFPTASTGWAVGDAGKVLKTTTGGVAWTPQNVPGSIDYKDVFFQSVDTGFAVGSGETIIRTTNGGREWRIVNQNGAPEAAHLHSIFFISSTRGWAVGGNGLLLQTSNGGVSWTRSTIADVTLYCVRFANAATGWATGGAGTILKTVDGGNTWRTVPLPSDLPMEPMLIELQEAVFTSSLNGCVVGSSGIILRTEDGGENWMMAQTPLGASRTSLFSIAFANASTGWAVGQKGTIWKTTNGGQTWVAQSSGTGVDVLAVHTRRDLTSTLWAGGRGGLLLYTLNGGTTWQKPGGGNGTQSQLNATDWVDPMHGWAVGMSGAMLRTVDGGKTWQQMTGGGSANMQDVYFVDSSTGYAVGSSGLVLKTTNGGGTWFAQDSGYTGANGDPIAILYGVRFLDYNRGWVIGGNSAIASTTNGGATWTRRSVPVANSALRRIVWPDENNGWIVGTRGLILRTSDGGATWKTQSSNTAENLYGIRMFGAQDNYTGYIVGDKGTILKTTNGGATPWMPLNSGITLESLNAVDFPDPQNGWVVGESGIVLRTVNGGATWTRIDAGIDRDLYDVIFTDYDWIWVVGSTGTIRKLN